MECILKRTHNWNRFLLTISTHNNTVKHILQTAGKDKFFLDTSTMTREPPYKTEDDNVTVAAVTYYLEYLTKYRITLSQFTHNKVQRLITLLKGVSSGSL